MNPPEMTTAAEAIRECAQRLATAPPMLRAQYVAWLRDYADKMEATNG